MEFPDRLMSKLWQGYYLLFLVSTEIRSKEKQEKTAAARTKPYSVMEKGV